MDWTEYLRFLGALIFVLAMIGLLAWLARRGGLMPGAPRRPTGGRRLAVQEVASLDPKRRLVLVRRDDVEHLLLLGASTELVIETGIPATPPEPTS
ncbi:MAG: flagellar biosynthetic protein FliO [Alphaproteobacteria bacterium]